MDDSKDESFYNAFMVDLCGTCKKESFLKCSQCNISHYCSVNCQRRDRKKHKILMQCLQDRCPILQVGNKIKFGELLSAQVFLTYVFSGNNHYFGDNEVHIDDYTKTKMKIYTDMGIRIDIPNICEQLMDQPIFKTYEGDVYYQNACFGMGDITGEGHMPTQDPIKISSGEDTKSLTPNQLLKIMSGGISLMFENDSEFHHYASSNIRPLFLCAQHNTVHAIDIHQFIKGVLLLFSCD